MRTSFSGVVLLLLLFPAVAFAQSTTITGQVTAEGSAIPGVTVSIDELGLTTVTGSDGRYVLTAPGDGRSVKVTATLQGFGPRSATVRLSGGDVQHDFALRPAFGQEITVGSRAAGAESEKAVPVDVIPREQIERQASTETNQILQKVSPSFNFPRPTITDGTDSVRPATLRGLGPDQVLVMLNSKRRHASALIHANNSIGRGSSGVDLNAIPASAIQDIEILRDGAAAQYGSDAIAGVLNIVLKSGEQPLTVATKGGVTTAGDGETLDASVSGGWSLGRGSIFGTVEYRNRGETNRANPDPREQVVPGDAGNNAVPQPNHHWGDAYVRDWLTFANFNMPISADDKHLLYAYGGYSLRHGSHGGFYRRGLDARNHKTIYPLGFLPLIEPRVVDQSLTGGVRGDVNKWFYDAGVGFGHNQFEFYVSDSLNASLGPTIPPNQTRFYAGSLELNQTTVNVDVSRSMRVGTLAGPLNVAFGVEYRRDNYQIGAGEPNSYIDGGRPAQDGSRAAAGAQVFPGFRPSNEVDVSRNSKSLYADFEGDVTAKFRLGVAGRYEDFSDFGDTINGKITARYAPIKQWIFRAAASTGFRAPSLGQSWFSAVSTNFLRDASGNLAPFEVGTYPVNSPIALALGSKPLEPEESRNYSAGVVWEPRDDFELTVDYFHIDITDRIVFSGNFTGGKVRELLAPFGVTGARYFTNAIDTETNGFDVVARHDLDFLGGRLDLSGAFSHNETDITRIAPPPPQLEGFQETLFDRIERRRVECGQPHNNFRGMESWSRGPLNITMRQSFYGEFCSFTLLRADGQATDDQNYSAKMIADAEVSYRWNDMTFALGAENLFNTYPERNIPNSPQGNFGIFTYPSHSPFGMNGRYVYTRVEYRF